MKAAGGGVSTARSGSGRGNPADRPLGVDAGGVSRFPPLNFAPPRKRVTAGGMLRQGTRQASAHRSGRTAADSRTNGAARRDGRRVSGAGRDPGSRPPPEAGVGMGSHTMPGGVRRVALALDSRPGRRTVPALPGGGRIATAPGRRPADRGVFRPMVASARGINACGLSRPRCVAPLAPRVWLEPMPVDTGHGDSAARSISW